MKHFLQKIKLIICGAGGKGGGQQPPPPNVSQYPAVLAPPQFSNLDSISSFSYAEMIDLLSDGPIEGIVNNNRRKVYDENIFEGIYLNDTPIKETSSVSNQLVDIEFLKNNLKLHFLKNDGKFTEDNINLTTIYASSLDVEYKNFTSDITIKSFAPSISVAEFIKNLNASFDAIPLIEKTFLSCPVLGERPFLTIIKIPRFVAFLKRDVFDTNRGEIDEAHPIKLDISNISNYIYFSISGENLNSFNYFELPRSFIFNNIFTAAGKKTIKNNLLSVSDTLLEYEFLDVNIYIWSLYDEKNGYKNIDSILDKYLKSIKINQNTKSLFNYNLVQSEFKNGLEYQAPLQYFNNIQIDTEYNKELIGPYKICGSYSPSNAFSEGGIQRVSKFSRVNQYTLPVTNTTLENETSDDIRYVKSWPIEYDCKNTPYIICNAVLNYSQFDRSSSSRVSQEAVPVTHYIENENVEEAFITLNINQLYDTNHIDLTADNSAALDTLTQSKKGQTDPAPEGINTYSEIVGYRNSIGYTSGNLYLLIYGSNYDDGYVIDGHKTTGSEISEYESGIVYNLNRLDKSLPNTLYYNAIDPFNGLTKCVPSLSTLIGKNLYNASLENCLLYYQIPNDSYLIRESFNIKNYSVENLESKLKLTTIGNNSFYYFGLDQNEQLLGLQSYSPSESLSSLLNSYTTNGDRFFIAKAPYRTASTSELTTRNIVAHIINSYINWDDIITESSLSVKMQVNSLRYLNIAKYIANPYLYLNQSRHGSDQTKWQKNIIGNIYLIGINGDYLRTNYGLNGSLQYLSLDVLEQLLDEFALKTNDSTEFNFSLNYSNNFNTNFSTLKAFENILLKFLNGKLIGSSSIFNLKPYYLKQYTIPEGTNEIKLVDDAFAKYNAANIFLINALNNIINNQEDKINEKDVIFEYSLYSNISQISILTPTSNAQYVDLDNQSDGTQKPNIKSKFVENGGKMIQQISAGTRLPTIVTIDVETGYEKKEDEAYIGGSEIFCYRYNIYGISNDQALIDVGRKSQPFLISCRLQSPTNGGYVNNYKNAYYNDNNLYLIESICIYYLGTSYRTSKTGYLLTKDKNKYSFGGLRNNSIELSSIPASLSGSKFSSIIENNEIVGLKEVNTGIATISSSYRAKVLNSFAAFPLKNKSEVIDILDVNKYFSDNYKKLEINKASEFLKSRSCFGSYLSPVQYEIDSNSVSDSNSLKYDKYLFVGVTNCLQNNIYNFSYDLYQRLYGNIKEDFEVQSQDFYAQLIEIQIMPHKIFEIEDTTGEGKEEELYFKLNEFKENFTDSLNSNFPVAFISNAEVDDDFYNARLYIFIMHKSEVAFRDIAYSLKNLINANLDSNHQFVDVSSLPYNSFAIDRHKLNEAFLLNLNNSMSTAKYFAWPPPPNLDSSDSIYLEINYSDFIKSASSSLLAYEFNKEMRINNLSYSYTNNRALISSTPLFKITATDKRLNAVLEAPNKLINAKFWTIFNTKVNELTVFINCSSRRTAYQELSCELDYLNLHCILGQYQQQVFLLNYTRYNGVTLRGYTNDFRSSREVNFYDPLYLTHLQDKSAFNNKSYFVGVVNPSRSNSSYGGLGIDRNTNYFQKPSKKLFTPFAAGGYFCCFDDPTSYLSSNGIFSKGFVSCIVYTSKAICYYYDKAVSSAVFNNFNPKLNISRPVCRVLLIKPNLNENNTMLQRVEEAFLDQNIIGSDYRFAGSYDTPPIYDQTFGVLKISYYEMNISNNSLTQANTLSSDTGLTIQIPKSKKDLQGNLMRRYIKVTKKSHETLSPLISKKISLQKVTEIIPQKFSYPFSAIVGTKLDSRAFSQIPTRTFHCKLKKVLIPSNYFIYDEFEEDVRYKIYKKQTEVGSKIGPYKIYEGDWDGSFKLGWTNNPAWIMLDLLINKRYGLGNYIESEQVDIWELYKISRWCDGVDDEGYYYGVSDLYGGIEPRHSFNAIINDKFNIFDLINQVASVFRGHVFYLNSLITFDDDRIKPIIGEFNNLDVKDGIFSYTNHKKDDEYTAADVAYVDARDNYKPKIEYVEDQEGIRQRGILKKQVNAFGVTSRAQARRFGLYFLYQTSKENSNVTFTTDNKILLYRPGDLIRINDELMSSNKNFGKVLDVQDINSSCFQVTIDGGPNLSSDPSTYCLDSITLYAPIAKPKYEDFYSKTQSIPNKINIFINSPFGLGGLMELKSGTNGFYRKILSGGALYSGLQFNLEPFDTSVPTKEFAGFVDVNYAIENLTGLNGGQYTFENAEYNTSEIGNPEFWERNSNFIDWTQQQILPQNKSITSERLTAFLRHIENVDIENIPSKYGHWEFTIGDDEPLNFKIKLDVADIQGDLSDKNYYFNYINRGKVLAASKLNNLQSSEYIEALSFGNAGATLTENLIDSYEKAHASANFGLDYIKYGPHIKYCFYTGGFYPYSASCLYSANSIVTNNFIFNICASQYKDSVISYQDIVENNRPSIDSFNIESYSYISSGESYKTNLILNKFASPSDIIRKSTVSKDLSRLMIGSPYSLNINNFCEKIYKIMSITENYINEYNVLATEFNLDKFKEIEDNYEIDNLKSTFNAITLHQEAERIETSERVKAPIILSIDYFVDSSNSRYVKIKWNNTQNNSSCVIYIQTPSKQTADYVSTSNLLEDFKPLENCFVKILKLPNNEIGLFTIMMQVKHANFVSPMAKRSINIFDY